MEVHFRPNLAFVGLLGESFRARGGVPFWAFFLGLGAEGFEQQPKDANQLVGLELGGIGAGVP